MVRYWIFTILGIFGYLTGSASSDSLKKVMARNTSDTSQVSRYASLCYFLMAEGKIKESFEAGAAGLQLAEKLNYKIGEAKCYLSIGQVYFSQGEYENALKNYRLSLVIFRDLKMKNEMIGVYTNIGNALYRMAKYPEALSYYNRALKVLKSDNNDPNRLARLYNNFGLVYYSYGNYPLSIAYYQKSLVIHENQGDEKSVASAVNNLGLVYIQLQKFDKALTYFQRALRIREKYASKSGISSALNNIGLVYENRQEYLLALEYYKKSLKLDEELGNSDDIASSYNNIGLIYSHLKKYDMALEFSLKSLEIRKKIKNREGQAQSLGNIGSVYFRQQKYAEAVPYLEEGFKVAEELKIFEVLKFISDLRMKSDSALGNYASAYRYSRLYTQYKDSLFNGEKAQEVGRIESEYKHEKEKLVRLQAQREKEKLEMRRYYLLGGLLTIAAFLTVFLWLRNRAKNKTNRLLSEKNERIESQKAEIERKNEKIEDSIRYAYQIQTAILPEKDYLNHLFSDYFIYYRPKDIVSGDFYWATQRGELLYFCLADCTGHGVPGAFMSVVGANALNHVINQLEINEPNIILEQLDRNLKNTLHQNSDSDLKDGMDISLLSFNGNKAFFSGAGRQIYHLRNGALTEIKGDKFPVGGGQHAHKIFTSQEINTEKGDRFYLFSDGITDQFGGQHKKKFTSKRLKEFILSNQHLNMSEQKEAFSNLFDQWMGTAKQLDDISFIGIEI